MKKDAIPPKRICAQQKRQPNWFRTNFKAVGHRANDPCCGDEAECDYQGSRKPNHCSPFLGRSWEQKSPYRRPASGRSHQPFGGYRGTPSPSTLEDNRWVELCVKRCVEFRSIPFSRGLVRPSPTPYVCMALGNSHGRFWRMWDEKGTGVNA